MDRSILLEEHNELKNLFRRIDNNNLGMLEVSELTNLKIFEFELLLFLSSISSDSECFSESEMMFMREVSFEQIQQKNVLPDNHVEQFKINGFTSFKTIPRALARMDVDIHEAKEKLEDYADFVTSLAFEFIGVNGPVKRVLRNKAMELTAPLGEYIDNEFESQYPVFLKKLPKVEKDQKDQIGVSIPVDNMSGYDFEEYCKKILEKEGFHVISTQKSHDGGIDLVAYTSQAFVAGKYIIQCKRYKGNIGEPIIRDLYGTMMSENANKGILMTTGDFTDSARRFADGKPIELINGDLLLQMGDEFESFDQKDEPCTEFEPVLPSLEMIGERSPAKKLAIYQECLVILNEDEDNTLARNVLLDILMDVEKQQYWECEKIFPDYHSFVRYKNQCSYKILELADYYLQGKPRADFPTIPQAILLAAEQHFRLGNFADAIFYWRKFLDCDFARMSLAKTYQAGEDVKGNHFHIDDFARVLANMRTCFRLLGERSKESAIKASYKKLYDIYNKREAEYRSSGNPALLSSFHLENVESEVGDNVNNIIFEYMGFSPFVFKQVEVDSILQKASTNDSVFVNIGKEVYLKRNGNSLAFF